MRRVSSIVGSQTCDAAEAARERLVFLDVFLVLAERRRGDHPDLAAREHRLEDVGRVRRRAERRAGADHRVRLVDEQDQVRPLLQLADDVLDAVLEHAAQHRAGDHRVHLQVDHLAVAQPDRHASPARTRCAARALRRWPSCRRRARRSASPSWRARGGRGSRAPAGSPCRGRRPAAACPAARAGSGWSRSASGTAAARTASSAALRAAPCRASACSAA